MHFKLAGVYMEKIWGTFIHIKIPYYHSISHCHWKAEENFEPIAPSDNQKNVPLYHCRLHTAWLEPSVLEVPQHRPGDKAF